MTSAVLDEGVALGRFGLLASALGGRPLAVAGTTGAGWTDGRTIFVNTAEEPRRQVITISALLGAGSLDASVLRHLTGRPNLTHRYLSIEGRRVLTALAGRWPAAAVPDAGPLPEAAVELACPSDSLQLARARIAVPPAPSWFGQLRPRRIDLDTARDPIGTRPPPRVDELTPEDEQNAEDAKDDDRWRARKPSSNPFSDNPLSRAIRRMFGSSPSKATSGDGAELRTVRAAAVGRGGVEICAPETLPSAVSLLSGTHGNLYPEWDEHLQQYHEEYCSVFEVVPAPDQLAPLDRPARHHGLRRELARLGLGPQRERAQRAGYDLDLDAAVDAQVLLAAGQTPPDTVYVDNLRHRRELVVLVLLDASGSGEEHTTEGETVFELQRTATAALVDTLSQLGDRTAAYAFRSRGREVAFTRLKGFDEQFSSATLHRIGGLRPGGFTRFGGAIRHATRLLCTDGGTHRRLLVVLSDGFPYDVGYEHSYAEGDSRRALDEARAAGVGCLCLHLGSSTSPDVLARIYARTEYATGADLNALTPSVLRLFHGAMRTAELRRRYGAVRADHLEHDDHRR